MRSPRSRSAACAILGIAAVASAACAGDSSDANAVRVAVVPSSGVPAFDRVRFELPLAGGVGIRIAGSWEGL